MANSYQIRTTSSLSALNAAGVPNQAAGSQPQNSSHPTDEDSRNLALTIAQAADDRKGGDIVLLKVSDVSYLADYFVVVTGFSNVQARAIARSIEEKVETDWQRLPLRTEGWAEGTWILMDYGDVIAHIFMPHEREFYGLEAFWGHAEQVPYSLSTETEIR